LMAHHCDGYSCAVKTVDRNLSIERSMTLMQKPTITDYDFFYEGAGQGCTFVMSQRLIMYVRELLDRDFDKIRKFHYHDWLVYAASRVLGLAWYFDSEPWMLYRQHSNNDTGARGSVSGFKLRLRFIRSGWYRNQILILAKVLSNNFSDKRADTVLSLIQNSSLRNTFIYCTFLFRFSRRKIKERIFLTVCCFIGWF